MVVALLTPFRPDGGVDATALGAHVDFLADAGVDAIMPCGTTGEGPLLSDEEVIRVIAAAGTRLPVIAHVGRPDTQSTISLGIRASGVGAGAVSAVVPYYYALDEEQVVRHYGELIYNIEVPVWAYTIPARTGNDLSAAAAQRLAEDGLAGVKDSTKSWERHLEFLAAGVEVLIGTDALVRQSFEAGSAGCVSALANVRPDLFVALRDGGGADVQEEIGQLRSALPFPQLKAAVAARIRGYPTAYRLPLG